eukprot:TRINITY_DN67225_c0_g1_i1.p1 TRINITY_DN67225_c0_g1~~TRINITY_DN67225_c0_g1_i1.p1  ORF type:complete len:1385 (-),score=187.98 TRINITY_DN67225_c0_g1_i1:225-3833(-)
MQVDGVIKAWTLPPERLCSSPFTGSAPAEVVIVPSSGMAMDGASAILQPLRPTAGHAVSTWMTAGAPSLVRNNGKWFYEVVLGRGFNEPQVGWAVQGFEASEELSGDGVGDDEQSWGADGERQAKWHEGGDEPAEWPREWQIGDVIGCAADLDAGRLEFFLNGQEVPSAGFDLPSSGSWSTSGIFPCLTLRGAYTCNIVASTFRFDPPSGYGPLLFPSDIDGGDNTHRVGSRSFPRPTGSVVHIEAGLEDRSSVPTAGDLSIMTMAFSGKHLYTGHDDGVVRSWQVDGGGIMIGESSLSGDCASGSVTYVTSIVVPKDISIVWAAVEGFGVVELETVCLRSLRVFRHECTLRSMVYSHESNILFGGTDRGGIVSMDTHKWSRKETTPATEVCSSVIRQLLLNTTNEGEVALVAFDGSTSLKAVKALNTCERLFTSIPQERYFLSHAVLGKQTVVVMACPTTKQLRVLDAHSGKLLRNMPLLGSKLLGLQGHPLSDCVYLTEGRDDGKATFTQVRLSQIQSAQAQKPTSIEQRNGQARLHEPLSLDRAPQIVVISVALETIFLVVANGSDLVRVEATGGVRWQRRVVESGGTAANCTAWSDKCFKLVIAEASLRGLAPRLLGLVGHKVMCWCSIDGDLLWSHEFEAKSPPVSIAAFDDGRSALVFTDDETLARFDVSSGRLCYQCGAPRTTSAFDGGMKWGRVEALMAVQNPFMASARMHRVCLWNIKRGTLLDNKDSVKSRVTSFVAAKQAVRSRKCSFFTGHMNGSIILWLAESAGGDELMTLRQVWKVILHNNAVEALSSGGGHLWSLSSLKCVAIHEHSLGRFQVVASFDLHSSSFEQWSQFLLAGWISMFLEIVAVFTNFVQFLGFVFVTKSATPELVRPLQDKMKVVAYLGLSPSLCTFVVGFWGCISLLVMLIIVFYLQRRIDQKRLVSPDSALWTLVSLMMGFFTQLVAGPLVLPIYKFLFGALPCSSSGHLIYDEDIVCGAPFHVYLLVLPAITVGIVSLFLLWRYMRCGGRLQCIGMSANPFDSRHDIAVNELNRPRTQRLTVQSVTYGYVVLIAKIWVLAVDIVAPAFFEPGDSHGQNVFKAACHIVIPLAFLACHFRENRYWNKRICGFGANAVVAALDSSLLALYICEMVALTIGLPMNTMFVLGSASSVFFVITYLVRQRRGGRILVASVGDLAAPLLDPADGTATAPL